MAARCSGRGRALGGRRRSSVGRVSAERGGAAWQAVKRGPAVIVHLASHARRSRVTRSAPPSTPPSRKRKGAVEPSRKKRSPQPKERAATRGRGRHTRARPAAVRREVWKRDGGQCAWRSEDGHRCDSTWKLELDHVVPAALGGPSTVENLRMCCRTHNQLHADHAFGRAHMELFRREAARTGEGTTARGSDGREGGGDVSGRPALRSAPPHPDASAA